MNKRFWSKRIADITPYTPGEQPKDRRYIKLNTNENPYPPAPGVADAINKFNISELRLYPDPDCGELRARLGMLHHLDADQVFVGNGSDELLAFSFLAFMDEDTPAIFPDITYSFYPVYSRFFENKSRIVPVNEDFTIPIDQMMQNDGTVIITNPNAPTGIGLPLSDIRRVLDANPDHVVIVDEAYVDFGCESSATLVCEYENLLVIQTFSKSRSMAGLRIGFAYGNRNLISALNAVKNSINSYTLDRIALTAALAAVADQEYLQQTTSAIIKTRDSCAEQLRQLGFQVLPSQSNFLFASHETIPAARLFQELRENGILVRYFNMPRIDNFLRITIGTDMEMDTLLLTLQQIVGDLL